MATTQKAVLSITLSHLLKQEIDFKPKTSVEN